MKTSIKLVLALLLLSQMTNTHPNQFQGTGNVATRGTDNRAVGQNNRFDGYRNKAHGKANNFKGNDNIAKGDTNDIEGDDNDI